MQDNKEALNKALEQTKEALAQGTYPPPPKPGSVPPRPTSAKMFEIAADLAEISNIEALAGEFADAAVLMDRARDIAEMARRPRWERRTQ